MPLLVRMRVARVLPNGECACYLGAALGGLGRRQSGHRMSVLGLISDRKLEKRGAVGSSRSFNPYLTSVTGTLESCTTAVATDPKKSSAKVPVPVDPMTIKSIWCRPTAPAIVSDGKPARTSHRKGICCASSSREAFSSMASPAARACTPGSAPVEELFADGA